MYHRLFTESKIGATNQRPRYDMTSSFSRFSAEAGWYPGELYYRNVRAESVVPQAVGGGEGSGEIAARTAGEGGKKWPPEE